MLAKEPWIDASTLFDEFFGNDLCTLNGELMRWEMIHFSELFKKK